MLGGILWLGMQTPLARGASACQEKTPGKEKLLTQPAIRSQLSWWEGSNMGRTGQIIFLKALAKKKSSTSYTAFAPGPSSRKVFNVLHLSTAKLQETKIWAWNLSPKVGNSLIQNFGVGCLYLKERNTYHVLKYASCCDLSPIVRHVIWKCFSQWDSL